MVTLMSVIRRSSRGMGGIPAPTNAAVPVVETKDRRVSIGLSLRLSPAGAILWAEGDYGKEEEKQ